MVRFRALALPLLAWLLTRAAVVAQVGFWDRTNKVQLQDVNAFHAWSDFIASHHAMPPDAAWQYPPGAAFLMLLPRIGGGSYGIGFVVLMLLFDLAGLALLSVLAHREGRTTGVWLWVLALPLLHALPVLRFDLVPTVIAIAALVVLHRRPAWFGALAGLGAIVKVWPALVLLGEWDRRRLARAIAAAAAVAALTVGAAALPFGDQGGFLSHESGRGLQVEAVAAMPWHLRQLITGRGPNLVLRNGAQEIESSLAGSVAQLLDWLTILVAMLAAAWWLMRDRAIRRGRAELTDPVLARDAVFTAVLLFVAASRVLSPQYLIWLTGMAAVVLSAGATRVARPAWIVVGAVVLTAGLYQSPANFVARNAALLFATVDASLVMVRVLRPTPAAAPAEPVRQPALTR